jgi:chorismate-pyruvate lyase
MPERGHNLNLETSFFDPTRDFFSAQERRPAQLERVRFDTLPPVLRVLLVKDGTVTTAISAYFLEPVTTIQVDQDLATLSRDNEWLQLPAGARVLKRRVTLESVSDGRLFVYAESLLAIDRLPANMQQALTLKGSNLGSILRDYRSETLREGLWFGRERLVQAPVRVARACDGDFLSRTYRVIADGQPLMMVTERFPLQNFS